MLINRQGKLRLWKWFDSGTENARDRVVQDIVSLVLPRRANMSNVVRRRYDKIIYKRYVSLYFIACIDDDDNELLMLELLHMFVESLDGYFGNVCELDLIFNFTQAHWILNNVFVSGELVECSKSAAIAAAQDADAAAEPAPEFGPRGLHHKSSASAASSSHRW